MSGVPQGSVLGLGPLLFLAYINDLPDCVKSSTAWLFADDCVVYKRIASPQDVALLLGVLLICSKIGACSETYPKFDPHYDR